MASSESSVAQTIVYLRPLRESPHALEVMKDPDNHLFVLEMAPPPKPVDIPLDENVDSSLINSLSPHYNTSLHQGEASGKNSPGLYELPRKVIRLEFTSGQNPPLLDFEFGSGEKSHIKIPFFSKHPEENLTSAYFRIHYNFDSGALLITSLDKMLVGSAQLVKEESLLLMPSSIIHCGGNFSFAVEFPDISDCTEEHEQNYRKYATDLGFPNAQYIPTSQQDYQPIGAEHKSVTVLGKGAFGEVHKALTVSGGRNVAIKILTGTGEDEMREVNVMSRLSHENIIKYERAFRTSAGQTCIVMELAVNDLRKQLDAIRNNESKSHLLTMQCVQSICKQALSALEYLHNQGFMHRDLKPSNLLVTKWDAKTGTFTIKLADFGLVGINPKHNSYCGTEGYMAPEIFTAGTMNMPMYTNSVDIWALGKILHDLVKDAYSLRSFSGKLAQISKRPALTLASLMMHDDPKLRPSASDCLKHPWITKNESSDILPLQKRERSPNPFSSNPALDTRLFHERKKIFKNQETTADH